MKRMYFGAWVIMVTCAFSFLTTTSSRAAGFALYEWSARGNGMGGALIALADEPSTVAYNPAGMTQLEGTRTQTGLTIIAPSAKLEVGGKTYDTVNKIYAAPHAYLTHQINDSLWVGFGSYTRFGVGTNYDKNWPGRYNVYKASLESYSLTPAVAYKVTDKWSVGAAVDCMYLSFDLRQYTSPLAPVGNSDLQLDNSGWAWGGNISTHYAVTDELSLGLVYRSPQRLVGSGKSKLVSADITEDLTMRANLPGSLSMGVAYRFTDSFRVEVDAIYTNWSDYDKIEYRFGSVVGMNAFGHPTGAVDSAKIWKDVWRYQLGAEWDINENHTIRAGLVYDESPIRAGYEDYMIPTNDRMMYSAGYTYSDACWSLDFSFAYLDILDRDIEKRLSHGVVDTHIKDSHAFLGGVSFSYKF